MNITTETPRVERNIGGKRADGSEVSFKVSLPAPYAAGPHELTEGEASALNQTISENVSNNLRARLVEGRAAVEANKAEGIKAEAARPFTAEEAQAIVDEYLTEYQIGVRRAGSGEPRVTDPVEREARKIARQKGVELVKSQGGKTADYDMALLTDQIFEANRELLMAEGAKIVEALNAAREGAGAVTVSGIQLPPSKGGSETPDNPDEEEEQQEEAAE